MSRGKSKGVNILLSYSIYLIYQTLVSLATVGNFPRFFSLASYLLHPRVLGGPHDPHHAYVIQDLIHVSDVRETRQHGDLFVRQRAGHVIVLEIT